MQYPFKTPGLIKNLKENKYNTQYKAVFGSFIKNVV